MVVSDCWYLTFCYFINQCAFQSILHFTLSGLTCHMTSWVEVRHYVESLKHQEMAALMSQLVSHLFVHVFSCSSPTLSHHPTRLQTYRALMSIIWRWEYKSARWTLMYHSSVQPLRSSIIQQHARRYKEWEERQMTSKGECWGKKKKRERIEGERKGGARGEREGLPEK